MRIWLCCCILSCVAAASTPARCSDAAADTLLYSITSHTSATSTAPLTPAVDEPVAEAEPDYDIFAFPSYDSDTGIGAGVKVFLLNHLRWNESVDVTAFASAKNERWFNAVFSVPDIETRQGKVYPLALDLVLDYDKYLKANFFPGYDNGGSAGMETYTREPVEVSATCSRGITPAVVASLGVRFKHVSTFGFHEGSRIAAAAPPSATGESSLSSALFRVRYDTRDSYVNPHSGIVLMGELERGARHSGGGFTSMTRAGLWLQAYAEAFIPDVIGALRVTGQSLNCDGAPLWMLNSLGGTSTLRGYAMDRFMGSAMMLANAELRCPVYKRLGGVVFLDAGTISPSIAVGRVDTFRSSPGFGLRLLFDTFVVRADVGFSSEGSGLYLNFGQLF